MCLSICKSLVVVLVHRKVFCLCAWALEISCLCAWVLVIWDYIVSEISLEVQGGHEYFRFVEGTCIIALCLSSLSLSYCVFIRCTLSLWSLLQKLIVICSRTVTSVGESKKKLTQFNPPSCVFLTFIFLGRDDIGIPIPLSSWDLFAWRQSSWGKRDTTHCKKLSDLKLNFIFLFYFSCVITSKCDFFGLCRDGFWPIFLAFTVLILSRWFSDIKLLISVDSQILIHHRGFFLEIKGSGVGYTKGRY